MSNATRPSSPAHRAGSDVPFLASLAILGGLYILLIVAMLLADVEFLARDAIAAPADSLAARAANLWEAFFGKALASSEIRYAIRLSLLSCSVTAVLSLWVAVP